MTDFYILSTDQPISMLIDLPGNKVGVTGDESKWYPTIKIISKTLLNPVKYLH